MVREFDNGSKFINDTSKDFDNGYEHDEHSIRGLKENFAVFYQGVHQRYHGQPLGLIKSIYDSYSVERISRSKRIKLMKDIQEKENQAVKNAK